MFYVMTPLLTLLQLLPGVPLGREAAISFETLSIPTGPWNHCHCPDEGAVALDLKGWSLARVSWD